MERLNMWQRGEAIDADVALSIHDEMPSGPEAVLDGSWEIRWRMPFSEQRSSAGQGKGGEEGGMGERGGAEELKQEEKKELRHWALSRSDSMWEPFDDRVGMQEVDLRRNLTKDQNLEGGECERERKKDALECFREDEMWFRRER